MAGVERCPECGSMRTRADQKCFICGWEPGRQASAAPAAASHAVPAATAAPKPPAEPKQDLPRCDLCGEAAGTNPRCPRCNPSLQLRRAPVEDDEEPAPPPAKPERTSPRSRTARSIAPSAPATQESRTAIYIGAATVAVFILLGAGYGWGRHDQNEHDQSILEDARHLTTDQEHQSPAAKATDPSPAAAPEKEHVHTLPGVAGVHWGELPSETAKTLSLRFRPVPDTAPLRGPTLLRYSGTFAGFPTSGITAEFCAEKLSLITVRLDAGQSSIYHLWKQSYEMLTSAYGPPQGTQRPPIVEQYDQYVSGTLGDSSGTLTDRPGGWDSDQFLAAVDHVVSDGADPLTARWDFTLDSSLVLSTQVTTVKGKAPVTWVRWTFRGPGSGSCRPLPDTAFDPVTTTTVATGAAPAAATTAATPESATPPKH